MPKGARKSAKFFDEFQLQRHNRTFGITLLMPYAA